jgi:hypothetical protein
MGVKQQPMMGGNMGMPEWQRNGAGFGGLLGRRM